MPAALSHGSGEYVASEGHQAVLPLTWRYDGTRRGMICCPALGGTNQVVLSSAPIEADANVAMAAFDFAGNDEWGNATSDSRMDSAWAFCKSRFGFKTDKAILLGISHGASTALNWAKANPTLVAAIALTIPAVDIQDIYDNNRSGLAASISAAHGGRPPDARTPARNAASFTSIPIICFYSTDDPICTPATVTAFCTATGATAVSVGAQGHSAANFDQAQYLNFIGQYA